ncbi:uncharacterized protein FIBRA_05961 [Fibroporia radiculosa]|uniref:Anaphase-promoting complex subunit 5 n=1 Tax=Fibroporia radiculosa TaxID=599839 RepID=J4HYC7_9APHY|nr:uncharacterized protein FIBRA_05961 [Fibroporia radiculosa]CCM03812.1 predicted protein [Fibroporia radiculosa]
MFDDTPRPSKRRRVEPRSSSPLQETTSESRPSLAPLPPAVLLVSLPALLAHPPNHRYYIQSLVLSLASLRKCVALPALSPEIECRAWTGLAEIGMKVIGGGFSQNEHYIWANGIEIEVEKALNKGSIIAQKHPSLRAYMHHLALLQAQLSHWQHKSKFSRNQIRNVLASFLPTDPPHIVYYAHLAYINLLTAPNSPPSSYSTSHTTTPNLRTQSLQDMHAGLSCIERLEELSKKNEHKQVTLLARVLRLRVLIAAGIWADVPSALQRAEDALGLSYETHSTPKPSKAGTALQQETTFIAFDDPFETFMVVHVLVMAVVFHTHTGSAADASPRLSHLHALLDSNAVDKCPTGAAEIIFSEGPPLIIETTHPRVLFLLAFLVSAVAKRDAVGRKPKRKVFATEGLATWETEFPRDISFALWAGRDDVEEVEQRLARIKADLLCELIAVSIMRSEFDVAEQNLGILIAHTRTYGLFGLFAARISLHHGHLAHALGQSERALDCYRVAAHRAEQGSFVEMAARVGEIALRLGLQRHVEGTDCGLTEGDFESSMKVVKECRGMGGTLDAIGQVIEACLTPEILKAKQHLKYALSLATQAQDNHLRALTLAMIASHYFHTAGDHALEMLQTCEQLAAGLGAPSTKSSKAKAASRSGESENAALVPVGNAPLGLWVGERFLELYRRAGKEDRAKKQAAINAQFREAVQRLARRPACTADDTSTLQ